MVGRSEARAARPPHHQPMGSVRSTPPSKEVAALWLQGGGAGLPRRQHQSPAPNSCQSVHVYMLHQYTFESLSVSLSMEKNPGPWIPK